MADKHTDKEHTESSSVVELTDLQAKDTAEPVEKAIDRDEIIAQFGLQSDKDVKTFLKSPEGKAAEALIEQEIANMAELHKEQEMQAREEKAMRYSLMTYLFSLFYASKARAESLNETIYKEFEKLLTKLHENSVKASALPNASAEQAALINQINNYNDLSTAFENNAEELISELGSVEEKLEAVEKQGENIVEKHDIYNEELNSIDKEYSKLVSLTPNQDTHKQPDTAAINTLDAKITMIKREIDTEVDNINTLLESGDPEKELQAQAMLNKTNAKYLQIAALEDMSSVIKKDKFLYKLNGDPATSFAEADFILPKGKGLDATFGNGKQIVKEGEKYYLLNKGQQINELSGEEKTEAAKTYQKLKPTEIMSVQKLVSNNKELEQADNSAKKTTLSNRRTGLKDEIGLIAQQLSQLQAGRANAELQLKQVTAQATSAQAMSAPAPTAIPTPAPTPTARPSKGNQPAPQRGSLVTTAYRALVQAIIHPPSLDDINRAQQTINQQPGMKASQQPALRATSDTLTNLKQFAGRAIPPILLTRLLSNIANIGDTMSQANISALNPSNPVSNSNNEEVKTAPTPFNTKPPGL